jgi:hypothetical protein
VGKGEKVLILYLPLATKRWNLSRDTKHWSLSRAPPSWDLLSPLSFSFSLKGRIRIIWSSLLERKILNSNLEKHLFPQPSLVGKKWLLLVDSSNKEGRMDVCSSF